VNIARAFAQQAQIDEAVNDLKPALGSDVVTLRGPLAGKQLACGLETGRAIPVCSGGRCESRAPRMR
jgi:hypothetical protein